MSTTATVTASLETGDALVISSPTHGIHFAMNTSKNYSPQWTTRCAATLLLCMLGMSSAQALTFCVNSVPLLKVALSQTQFFTAAPVNIQIVQGTYLMDADMVYTFAPPTTIEGGYTANCAARVVNPANTVINIGLGHIVDLRQPSSSPEAQLNIDGLTLINSDQYVYFEAGALGAFSNDEGSVNLSRMRMTQINGENAAIDVRSYNGLISLENVQFDHISNPSTCMIGIHSNGAAGVVINHMSADLAIGNDICMPDDHSHAVMQVYNSILWSSTGGNPIFRGLGDSTSETAFVNDIFKGHAMSGTVTVQNQINADPGWINPAGGNYRLQTAPLSAAVNSGTTVTFGGEPATDIEGNPRVVGSAPDRGAYESSFNNQSVLTVTNTLDSGVGSLRQAMIEANSTPVVAKSIQFDIRGAGQVPICPAVIALNTVLPAVASTMTIDGYTQLLSTKNTSANAFNANLCIFLKPASGSLAAGFRVSSAAGAGTCAPGSLDADGDNGTFVWSDSRADAFVSTGPDQFLVRADAGVMFNANTLASSGVDLVVGAAHSTGDADTELDLVSRSGKIAFLKLSDSTGHLTIGTVGSGHFIQTNDRFGVIRTPSANALEVEGAASKTTAGSWLANSDRRIKTAIEPIDDALATINRLAPVTFRYSDAYRRDHASIGGERYFNVIAQDFREVFPDAVHGSGEFLPGMAKTKSNEILQVDTYPALITAIAALQELDAKDSLLDERYPSATPHLLQKFPMR